ncbi:MAG: thymidine phosphorylase [Candidatus Poseidoniaceae archaeon]|jgi:pyrimidine-nucleoside phosphorylase|nr:thymidine phosphorylase [Candidatus Poseidoniaceae archaeon]
MITMIGGESVIEVIGKKRDGHELDEDDFSIICHAASYAPPAQIGAFLMACQIHGLSKKETALLTKQMMYSGASFEPEPGRVDKHSTGGVGDKMSIILAPALRAAGAVVPMIAGRGLEHTGGTIDKLEAIPGFNTGLTFEEMEDNKCFISRQTEDIAPADSIFYQTRDITGTVAQLGLITASIVSKKAAEGLEKLVLDVKCGRAAFMKNEEDAIELAKSMVTTGHALGIEVTAQITRMDYPIGKMIGNAHEIVECVECLRGQGPWDTMELVHMQANALGFDIKDKIYDGSALDEFREMCIRQGVDEMTADMLILEPWSVLSKAPDEIRFTAEKSGYITDIDALLIGQKLCEMGAGRTGVSNDVDHGIGIELIARVGDFVKEGDVWAILNYNSGRGNHLYLYDAITISENKPKDRLPILIKTISIDDCN